MYGVDAGDFKSEGGNLAKLMKNIGAPKAFQGVDLAPINAKKSIQYKIQRVVVTKNISLLGQYQSIWSVFQSLLLRGPGLLTPGRAY